MASPSIRRGKADRGGTTLELPGKGRLPGSKKAMNEMSCGHVAFRQEMTSGGREKPQIPPKYRPFKPPSQGVRVDAILTIGGQS
jgi:hypothetical protein